MSELEPLMTLLVQWTIYLNAVGGVRGEKRIVQIGYAVEKRTNSYGIENCEEMRRFEEWKRNVYFGGFRVNFEGDCPRVSEGLREIMV